MCCRRSDHCYTQLRRTVASYLVTLIAGKRRCLLFAGDGGRSVRDKKLQHYAEDNSTEYHCMR